MTPVTDDRLKELAFNFDMEGLAKPNDVILEIDSALNELLTARQTIKRLVRLCTSMWNEMQDCDGYYHDKNRDAYIALMQELKEEK